MPLPLVDHGPNLSVPVGDAVPGSGPPPPPDPVPASIADVNAAIAAVVAGAPALLNTLAEIDAQLATDETGAASLVTAVGQRIIAVYFATLVDTARPTSPSLPVLWIGGPNPPNNRIANDLWYDTTLDLLKRFNGSTWVADAPGRALAFSIAFGG